MSDVILSIKDLSKSFYSHWTFRPLKAVENVSLDILRGESFGFLGHNGAGKTTTIKCIVGLIRKTKGSIAFDGKEIGGADWREKIGYLPEQPYFYDHLTVGETLTFFSQLHGFDRAYTKKVVDDVLALVKLENRRNSPVRALSKGLQQRLGFAQAILNKPRLLILDEPFSGLDPIGRLEIRNLILGLKKQGTTIFMSSHILSDVEDVCDRVSIMSNGELKKVFSLREIPDLFGRAYELKIRLSLKERNMPSILSEIGKVEDIEETSTDRILTYRFPTYEVARAALDALNSKQVTIESFNSRGLNLEEIFMKITEASRSNSSEDPLAHTNNFSEKQKQNEQMVTL